MSTDDADFELVWEKMWVGRPQGTHFSARGSSPLARGDDTNQLQTHATLGDRVVDDDEGDDGGEGFEMQQVAAGIALGVLLTIAAINVAPKVRAWWQQRRVRKAASVDNAKQVEPIDSVEPPPSATVAIAHFSKQVDAALSGGQMSSEETQRRILEVMLAAAVIADNMRALADVPLDNEASAQLQEALRKLAVPEVTASLNRTLKLNRGILDAEGSAEVLELFGGGRTSDGQFVPIDHARVQEALRLPFAA